MAITGMQFNGMWARHFGGSHSYSVTVQVNNHNAIADCSLYSTWTGGADHHASDAFITQIVSASGVENFPAQNNTVNYLVPVVYRNNVTSVTFKISVYKTKGMARWMIFHWG